MITPRDVLEVAERLREAGDEASHRSAISRAYFAAFLHLRDVTGIAGSNSPRRGASDHGRVQSALEPGQPVVARQLARLRIARNEADYDLDIDLPPSRAAVAIMMARRLLDTSAAD